MRARQRKRAETASSPIARRGRLEGSGVEVGGSEMLLSFRVTAPFIAKALPSVMLAPVSRVMLVRARILP